MQFLVCALATSAQIMALSRVFFRHDKGHLETFTIPGLSRLDTTTKYLKLGTGLTDSHPFQMSTGSSVSPSYPGPEQFSYVPEGIISLLAPTPGPLCLRCHQLDIPGLFIDPPIECRKPGDELKLDRLENVLEKATRCDFCYLVVAALRARAPTMISSKPSIDLYMKTTLAGSYYSANGRKLDVYCIAVYTVGNPSLAYSSSYPLIRLLANDAHLLGQYPMYHGRVTGNHISPKLLWSWIHSCRDHHEQCKAIRQHWDWQRLTGPRSLTLVDPTNMCLIRHSVGRIEDYIALSYVWGGHQGLQLTRSNKTELYEHGALRRAWKTIPAVIQDAIELISLLDPCYSEVAKREDKLGEHLFLWVDQLCIVQDDPNDKSVQIEQMGHIYSKAMATFVATEGSHSNTKLARHHPGEDSQTSCTIPSDAESTPPIQAIRNVGGLRLVSALPRVNQFLENCTWNTRAWTLQEAELSHSLVIFTKAQVYFRCAQDVFQEDVVSEIPQQALKQSTESKRVWHNPQALERRQRPAIDTPWPQTFVMYATAVESYTRRAMTFPEDVIRAFKGVTHTLYTLSAWQMPNGLVADVIDFALLWRPTGVLRRRFVHNGDPHNHQRQPNDLALPTYAWSAWVGPVTYEPVSYEMRSLISRFDIRSSSRSRRVVRYSQEIDGNWDDTLESTPPFAPQDCSWLQNVGQGLSWVRPQARSLAFKMHLVDEPNISNRDGPGILQFRAPCISLLLANRVSEDALSRSLENDGSGQSCGVVLLCNTKGHYLGFVWQVALLDEMRDVEVDLVLLSRCKYEGLGIEDVRSQIWNGPEGYTLNVMLIKRLPLSDLAERITIGKIHEDCAANASEEMVRLV